ncbi:MAG: hypothetical protein NC094_13285 [Bacteroidales bacterium]|nr:hypothetical protein [Lachnoclostridium sp.]MCM1383672.1 hypothetical protein [Lachnoclostridium sp.]MCM1466379.1 hypothetical protein [Bacteroidales bacterium]
MDKEYDVDDLENLPGIPFTRFVGIQGDGLEGFATNAIIDAGLDAVSRIYGMAEKSEIPYAEGIELDYFANCKISFKGKNLLRFLKEYYPDKFRELEDIVNPDGDYTLMCLDFS